MSDYANPNEYRRILSRFDVRAMATLDPRDFVAFGVMDSRQYAAKLFRIMDDAGLTPIERTMVVALATAVKSKKRILAAMSRFRNKAWYDKVYRFFNRHCCQYTGEEDNDLFSVVHIPSCVPFLTSRCWLQMTQNPTVDDFLHNLWAAQINLDNALMQTQRQWETFFWTTTVTKGSRNFEAGAFNASYWETKASDAYILLNPDGSMFGTQAQRDGTATYSRADIQTWIGTKEAVDDAATDGPHGAGAGGGGGGGGGAAGGGGGGGAGPQHQMGPPPGRVQAPPPQQPRQVQPQTAAPGAQPQQTGSLAVHDTRSQLVSKRSYDQTTKEKGVEAKKSKATVQTKGLQAGSLQTLFEKSPLTTFLESSVEEMGVQADTGEL